MTSLVSNKASGIPDNIPTTPIIITDINDKRLYSESNVKVAIFADDQPMNRKMFIHIAKDKLKDIANLFILCFDDGNKVIPALRKLQFLNLGIHEVVVLVLDEEMPGMGGSDTARAVREIGFKILIYSYSANEGLHERNQSLSSLASEDDISSTSEVSLPASPASSGYSSRSSSFLSERRASASSDSGKLKRVMGRVLKTLRRASSKAPISPEFSPWPSPSISPAPSAWSSPASSSFTTPSSSRSSSISMKSPEGRSQLLFDKVFLKPKDSLELMKTIREALQPCVDEDDSKSQQSD